MDENVVVFLVLGVVGALVVWIVQRSRWSRLSRVVLSLAILLVFGLLVFAYLRGIPVTLGPREAWYHKSPACEAVLFLLMLLGMTARYFAKAIEARREKIAELRKKSRSGLIAKPPLEFDAWEFAYPLLISVVTFGALLSQLKEPTLSIASLTLSFQTGFFWQTILATREKVASA